LDQITATYLHRRTQPAGDFRLQQVKFAPDGIDIAGTLDHQKAKGPAALRLTVDDRGGSRFVLHLRPTQLPPELADDLEAYRDVLERLNVHVDLDLSGPAATENR
jgi:hypothetical protein